MSRKISPKQLKCNLWRSGPYIFYFNSLKTDRQKDLVKFINILAKKSPFVDVLEVDWDQYVEYEVEIPYEIKYNINLYFKGKQELTILFPDKEQIIEVFNKAKLLYYELQKSSLDVKNKMKVVKHETLSVHKSLTDEQKKRKRQRSRVSFRKRQATKYSSLLRLTEDEYSIPFFVPTSKNIFSTTENVTKSFHIDNQTEQISSFKNSLGLKPTTLNNVINLVLFRENPHFSISTSTSDINKLQTHLNKSHNRHSSSSCHKNKLNINKSANSQCRKKLADSIKWQNVKKRKKYNSHKYKDLNIRLKKFRLNRTFSVIFSLKIFLKRIHNIYLMMLKFIRIKKLKLNVMNCTKI